MVQLAQFWLIAVGALLVVAACLGLRAYARMAQGAAGRTLALSGLRLAVLGLCLLLARQVLYGGRTAPVRRQRQPGETDRILVLQDKSRSMEFRTEGRTRDREADAVWERLLREAKAAGLADREVQRLFFAAFPTPEEDLGRLDREATRLATVTTEVLARRTMDAVLVLSDGASTDGPVPRYVLDWAANRGVGVFAVCTGGADSTGCDIAVTSVECAEINPEQIRAVVVCSGPVPEDLRLTFELDGVAVAERTPAPALSRPVAFRVAGVGSGWHEFAVRASTSAREFTLRNNVRRGVFRIASQRILFLHDTPRIENLQLGRLLRREYRERLTVTAVTDPALVPLALESYRLVIIGDVAPSAVPSVVLTAAAAGQLRVLVLAGEHFKAWQATAVPGFPVRGHLGPRDLGSTSGTRASVVHAPAHAEDYPSADVARLAVSLLYGVRLGPECRTPLLVQLGNSTQPLLIANPDDAADYVVVTVDTTWKWALHPEPAVRLQYGEFWRSALQWCLGDHPDSVPLSVAFDAGADSAGFTDVRVRCRRPADLPRLGAVSLEIDDTDGVERVRPEPASAGYSHRYSHAAAQPYVAWFKATAALGEARIASERTPLLVDRNRLEWAYPMPRPDLMAAMTREQSERFGDAAAADAVIRELLAFCDPGVEPPAQRQRHESTEASLAVLILLVLGAEWWLERRQSAAAGLS